MTSPGPDLIIYTDGASRGNPGPGAIGVVLANPQGQAITQFGRVVGQTTNNRAEYLALLAGLQEALEQGAKRVLICLDSELVVRQLTGRYRVRHQALQPLFRQVTSLLSRFEAWEIRHVPRELNRQVDALANRALDRGY